MRIIIDPPILAVMIYIRDFNGDFTDFTKDFRFSREISGEVYEISVSGGPLGFNLLGSSMKQISSLLSYQYKIFGELGACVTCTLYWLHYTLHSHKRKYFKQRRISCNTSFN